MILLVFRYDIVINCFVVKLCFWMNVNVIFVVEDNVLFEI